MPVQKFSVDFEIVHVYNSVLLLPLVRRDNCGEGGFSSAKILRLASHRYHRFPARIIFLSRRHCHSGWPSSELLNLRLIVGGIPTDSQVATSSSYPGRAKWYVPRLPPCRLTPRLTEFPHNSALQNGSLHSLPKTRPRSSKMSPNSSYHEEHACATSSNTKASNLSSSLLLACS